MCARDVQIIEETELWCAHNYKPLPVVIENGEGAWVHDTEGRKYLDMISSYSALNQGHRHPRIIQALVEQAQKLTLTSRAMHNDKLGSFLNKLCNLAGFEKALPMNTGAEAVETALKLARKWGVLKKGVPEHSPEIIVCDNNFHGRTIAIISFSTEAQYKFGFGPLTLGFKVIPFGDASALEKAITQHTVGFLVEPIQGEGGVVVPPEGFLKSAREITKKHNILFMLDEIQTGLARTGKLFAWQYEDAKPDVLILGKALGGGLYPVSAVLADDAVMDVFTPGDHGSTFGGNPLGAAVAMAALDVIVDEKLAEQAYEKGRYLREKLEAIQSPHIRQIRGKGLLVGVEIKEASGPAKPFCLKLMEHGILCKDTHHQIIRLAPPLVVSKEDLDFALEKISVVLT